MYASGSELFLPIYKSLFLYLLLSTECNINYTKEQFGTSPETNVPGFETIGTENMYRIKFLGVRASDPSDPSWGDIYYNSSDGKVKMYISESIGWINLT